MGYLLSDPYSKRSTLHFLIAYSTITLHLVLGPKKDKPTEGNQELTMKYTASEYLGKSLSSSSHVFKSH